MGTVLNREAILDAALDVIDKDGPDALTMRGVAEQLGVTATAIYHHFDGRDAVLEGLVDRVCAAMVADAPTSGAWRERLRALLTGMVTRSLDHPAMTVWAITTYARKPPVVQLHDALREVLREAGFSKSDAEHAKGVLLRYCVGHLVLATADGPFPRGFDPDEQLRRGLDTILKGLAPKPNTR
jgi:AcrR family transcriptional regulator